MTTRLKLRAAFVMQPWDMAFTHTDMYVGIAGCLNHIR